MREIGRDDDQVVPDPMLSAPAHQIVLIVNGIYLRESLKLGKRLRVHLQNHATTLTAPQRTGIGEIVPVSDGAVVDLAGLVESGRRAVPIPSRQATSGMAKAELNVAGGPRVRIRFPPLASQAPGWRPLAWGNGFPRLQRINARESLLSRDQPNLW